MRRICFIVLFISASLFATPLPVKKSIFAPRQPIQFETRPIAAFNSKTNQTLVVWERHPGNHPGHSTWGRLVGPSGNAVGPLFQIVSGPNPYYPSVEYNSTRNEFALIFSNEPRGRFVAYLQRLNSRGRPIGAAVQVSTDDPGTNVSADFPRVVFSPRTGNYIAFWIRSAIEPGLYGAVLRGDLSFISRGVLIRRSEQDENFILSPLVLDAAYHAATGKIVILFYQYRPGFGTAGRPQLDFYLGIFNEDLTGIQPSSFVKVNTNVIKGSGTANLVFLPDGTGLVAFEDTSNVKLRKISAALSLSGPAFPAFKPPLNNRRLLHPDLAFSNGAAGLQGILTAVQDPFNTTGTGAIWAQRLNQLGRPVGSPFQIEKDFDRVGGQELFPLPIKPTSDVYRFISIYVQGGQTDAPPLPDESSGLILLNFGFNDDPASN